MDDSPYEFQFQNGAPPNYDCLSVVWSITVLVNDVIEYYNPIFYSGNTLTAIPTQNLYLNELNTIANELNLIFINNGTTASFINEFGCDGNNLNGTSFKINLDLTVETCESKNFEDGECFGFMDGDVFQFEDQ
jgi:hypothetical protein